MYSLAPDGDGAGVRQRKSCKLLDNTEQEQNSPYNILTNEQRYKQKMKYFVVLCEQKRKFSINIKGRVRKEHF